MASNEGTPSQDQLALISGSFRGVPDFPKPGILFWDMMPLLLNPKAFQCCIDLLAARYAGKSIDVVAGARPRARVGWLFGAHATPCDELLGVAFETCSQ